MKGVIGEIIASLSVAAATLGVIIGVLWYETALKEERRAIDLEAHAVSTWSKKEIVVKKGEPVRIRIRNVDNVTHGFAIPELDVEERIIRAGRSEMVEFTPKHAGRYVYKCIVQCSRDKHDFMTGTLVVAD